jgi:enolase
MVRGAKRKRAGRPTKRAAERGVTTSLRLKRSDLARLRAAAKALGISRSAVVLMGIVAAESELRAKKKREA